MSDSSELIGSREAAAILGVSQRHFNRTVTRKQITPALVLGPNTGARLFRRADVEALVKKAAAA